MSTDSFDEPYMKHKISIQAKENYAVIGGLALIFALALLCFIIVVRGHG